MTYAYLKLVIRKQCHKAIGCKVLWLHTRKQRASSREVKSITQAARKDVGTDIDLKEEILDSISKMKQLAVFPERQKLYSMLTGQDMRPVYKKLVSSLMEDYLKLFIY